MRVAAVVLGLAGFGGLVVLAVAGVSGATAVLVTGAAVVGMIGLGNLVGGRRTPDRAPYGAGPDDGEGAGPGAQVEDADGGEGADGGEDADDRRGTPER